MADSSFQAASYAALLVGGLLAYGLSGIVSVQSIVYFKLFPREYGALKAMVSIVWLLDLTHSAFVGVSLWYYFIQHWGDNSRIDVIPWSVAFTVIVTAITTFITHCYFANKIYRSSQKNLFLTVPILLLSFCRLLAASVSTSEMMILQHYSMFTHHFPSWIFTTGLSLSSGTDILVTCCLCYLLREIRRQMGSTVMIQLVDTLTLYTLENGLLTCLVTTASLIFWLVMPHNLVFLGLHFIIEKLYANSILASLNTRKELRGLQSRYAPWSDLSPSLPVLSGEDFIPPPPRDSLGLLNPLDRYTTLPSISKGRTALEVNVQQVIERTSEEIQTLARSYTYSSRRSSLRRPPTILQWQRRSYPDYEDEFDIILPGP